MTNPLRGVTFPGLPGEFQIPQNAEDVGARPDTWMPSAADVGALPAAFSGTISDAWVSNKTYYVGDYCIHNNTLWRCLVQNAGVTPVEGTYWTEVSVAKEITKSYDTEQIVGVHNGSFVYRSYIKRALTDLVSSSSLAAVTLPHGLSNIKSILHYDLATYNSSMDLSYPLPYYTSSGAIATYIESVNKTNVIMRNNAAWGGSYYLAGFLYYTR